MQAVLSADYVCSSLALCRYGNCNRTSFSTSFLGRMSIPLIRGDRRVLEERAKQAVITSALGSGENVNPFLWIQQLLFNNTEKEEKETQQLTRNWHPTTKGTLVRKFRVPSSKEGQRLLQEIAGLLSDDDLFRDARTHKGCRIQRQSAHGQSVCCNNVRGLFDELPIPHLELEITVFPQGPLTTAEYQKAAKLEEVLKKGHSI